MAEENKLLGKLFVNSDPNARSAGARNRFQPAKVKILNLNQFLAGRRDGYGHS